MNKLLKLLRCTPSEIWTLLQALFLLPIVKYRLEKHGYKKTKEVLERFVGNRSRIRPISPIIRVGQARTMARLIRAAANVLPWKITCLPKSLILWWLLQRKGVTSNVRIGVRFFEGEFKAHAWVEYLGSAVNDSSSNLSEYSTFEKIFS